MVRWLKHQCTQLVIHIAYLSNFLFSLHLASFVAKVYDVIKVFLGIYVAFLVMSIAQEKLYVWIFVTLVLVLFQKTIINLLFLHAGREHHTMATTLIILFLWFL